MARRQTVSSDSDKPEKGKAERRFQFSEENKIDPADYIGLGIQNEGVYKPGYRRSDRHHKGDRESHAESRIDSLRYSDIRTNSQEFREYKIVDKDRPDDERKVMSRIH